MLDPNTVVVAQPKYLVRIWGRDEEEVAALRKPDAIEQGQTVLCYWFDTPTERTAFLSTIPSTVMIVRSVVDPDEERDTSACTWAHIVLRLPDGRVGTFRQCFGYGYPTHSVEFMWREGNYSCDCNKRLYLARECGIDPEYDDLDKHVECGDTIELVSLEIYHTYLGDDDANP